MSKKGEAAIGTVLIASVALTGAMLVGTVRTAGCRVPEPADCSDAALNSQCPGGCKPGTILRDASTARCECAMGGDIAFSACVK